MLYLSFIKVVKDLPTLVMYIGKWRSTIQKVCPGYMAILMKGGVLLDWYTAPQILLSLAL